MTKHNAILGAILPITACTSISTGTPAWPTAGVGQVARLEGVQVHPLRLIEDSRCPVRVRCVWAGRLRIEAVIQYKGGSEELRREVTLGEAIALPEGNLTLTEASPAPKKGQPKSSKAYRFRFMLEP